VTDGLVISDLHEDPDLAILLLGGNKAGRWKQRYDEAISQADRRYDRRLGELRDEGLLDGGGDSGDGK